MSNHINALLKNIFINNSKLFVVIIFFTYSIVCWINVFFIFSSMGTSKYNNIHRIKTKKEAIIYFWFSLKNNLIKLK